MKGPTVSADLVIRGGTVIDGSGSPGVRADVAVEGDRIVEIDERIDANGARTLDASGQVVAPGFVDIHTHYDAQVFWDPALTPSSWHGVTSVVAGNCGFSLAPCRPEHRALMVHTLEHVEDMSPATLTAGVPWDFETFPEYLDSVERRGTVINYGAYIGHTALRLWVMGDAGYEREATDDELARMADVVREAVAAGAAGFASSSSTTHSGDGGRPVPSRIADVRELEIIMAPLGELGRGVIELLPGEKIKHADVYALQRKIGRPITWTALLTVKGFPWHLDMAALNDKERAEGVDVWPQISVRPLSFSMNMAEPFTFNMSPSFAALMGKPIEEKVATFRDAQWRAVAQEELESGRFFRVRWDRLTVSESERFPQAVGRSVADLAAERGIGPLDLVLELSCEEGLETRFRSVLANDDDEAIEWLLQQQGMLIGLSDAGAHVSQLCDACMATDLLGNWVRERGALPLEAAVRKLTGEPADVYDLAGPGGRGYVRTGMAADLVVFDPDTVGPGPLRRMRDFPADGERLVADQPSGMTHVLVNGTAIRVDGEPVEEGVAAKPGTLLRG
jgi:N-acyl-D-aspartate/D-glutamate deacylase